MTREELERAVDVLMRRTVTDRGLPETITDGDALRRTAVLIGYIRRTR